ncbi:MAG: nucleoside hydrolase [Novosphingobium sp.]|uniref:nucleoside hydrolase n=1 Tax=Novosphingobium sp. TaxID=1874826 RepID=UPI002735C97B|nr:nucleoside hydrolase [Novosphingobium sp.]MDP3549056.1 nucleoside hydrolase [Novosphingobium sp.]
MINATSRRTFTTGLLGGLGTLALPLTVQAQPRIPQRPSARVIVDNDFAGDPDGLVALAHQLLAEKTRTVLVTVSLLDPKLSTYPPGTATREGAKLAADLIARIPSARGTPVRAGRDGVASTIPSEAAKAIVAEAMRDDPLPLIFTCGGPLTNLADALTLEPRIASRLSVVWIGGGTWPDGGWEYNLATDIEAARHVIEQTTMQFMQVPQNAYRQMQMSVAELAADMRSISPLGRWLYDRFTHPPAFVDLGGTWPMGDSPLVLLTALTTESSRWVDRPARRIKADCTYGDEMPGRTIRVFETIDARLVWADFLARLRLAA